jgi:hypothetical protein
MVELDSEFVYKNSCHAVCLLFFNLPTCISWVHESLFPTGSSNCWYSGIPNILDPNIEPNVPMKKHKTQCLSYELFVRELSKKAQKANNIWWRLSGLLGDRNRQVMYILLQALFTVATMALTVPIFLSYRMHVVFLILKVCASTWNGGSFILEVMPRQVERKQQKKLDMKPIEQGSWTQGAPADGTYIGKIQE